MTFGARSQTILINEGSWDFAADAYVAEVYRCTLQAISSPHRGTSVIG